METRDRVLTFIYKYRQRRYFGPTTREIADGVGLASNSTVVLHLIALQREGLVTWSTHHDGVMITRSIRLTRAGMSVAEMFR